MRSIDEKIANEIWPQYARLGTDIPYADKVEQAKQYLGNDYLLAHPINRKRS
jgi:hypothetical protein